MSCSIGWESDANCCFLLLFIYFFKQYERKQRTEADEAPGRTGSSGTKEELLSVDDNVSDSAGPSAPKRRA